MKKKQPYNDSLSITFILAIAIGLLIVFSTSSCTGTKKDCKGVTHYKQKGGFYL